MGGRGDRLAIYTHLLRTMAPRLSKRQIRELEELAALDKEDDSPVENVSVADKPAPQPKTGAFAAVGVLPGNGVCNDLSISYSLCPVVIPKTKRARKNKK